MEAYTLTNQMKYDTKNKTQKHILYKHFIAWHCDGCLVAPITVYIKNPIFQDWPSEKKLLTKSDERLYVNIRDNSRG